MYHRIWWRRYYNEIRMKPVIDILSRETLVAILTEGYEFLRDKDETVGLDTFRVTLVSVAFAFLRRFTIQSEEVPMIKYLIGNRNIKTLKEIHPYNYNKLKIIIDKK